MKLEELIQKLDAANPWTVERVEAVFGAKLRLTYSNDVFRSYTTSQLLYEEGLNIEQVELRLRIATNGLIRLIVDLSDNASCFTLDRIKKAYPDTEYDPYGLSPGGSLNATFGYWTKRPWGHIDFGFRIGHPDCLSYITLIPKGGE